MTEILSIKLLDKQTIIKNKILQYKKKFNIIQSSRQAGKTVLCIQMMTYYCINIGSGLSNLYVTPTYSLAKIIFNKFIDGLDHTGVIHNCSKSDLIITFKNNNKLYFKSAESHNTIRGMSISHAIIDEAAYITQEAWMSSIRPTMNVAGKQCIIVSTPKGKNTLFHTLCILGKADDNDYTHSFIHYTDNPYYDLQEVEDAKKTLPHNIFLQEYEGKFIESGGEVFINLDNIQMSNYGVRSKNLYAGLDLGKSDDYTVLIILNDKGEVVYIESIRQQNWNLMIDRIISILKIYNPYVVIEVNSIGDVVFDRIKKDYKKVIPFLTTNNSKQDIIEDLILSINDNKINIPNKDLYPQLYNELESYTYEYLPKTRKVRYNAPPGLHDDHVMSLAFANNCIKNRLKNRVSFKVL